MSLAREEGRLDATEYAALVRSAGLDRPVDDLPRMAALLAGSDLVVTARDGAGDGSSARRAASPTSRGAATCPTSSWAARGGIGRLLLAETKRAVGPGCMVRLVATPAAAGYYPRLGMEAAPNAFLIRRDG